MRIGLDLDGVLVDWSGNARRMLNERGEHIPDIDPPYWDWIEDQVSSENWKWLWGPGMKMSYQTAQPLPGAVKFARKCRDLGDVVIMTSRPEGSWTSTIQWWKDYVGYTPAGYNFFRKGTDKHNVWVDCFVEDNLENATTYADANLTSSVFLLDRAYNSGYNTCMDRENLTKVYGYQMILDKIERLKNENTK